jgi:hypothetical protein
MPKENRKYKDSVFTDLFSTDEKARENLLELSNALYDTEYINPEVIDIISLEEVLFKNFKNDVAFTVGKRKVVLSEHQSSINPNMPLRNLMYIAREYEKIMPVKDRYKSKQIKIPTPSFIVFYNGEKDYPSEQILRLSDAFMDQEEEFALELTVRVININPEKNHEILKKCKILREYSQFVEATRKYGTDKNKLQKAVKECIRKNILADYLQRKSSEVVNMLMEEYDYATDIEVQREEAAEEAAAKATAKAVEEAEKKLVEHVKKIAENFHVSEEKACETLDESYERYKGLKQKYC